MRFCVAKEGESKMGGNNMRKELCRVCARRKKGGLLYFEVNTPIPPLQPRSLNGEKSIQRLQSNHVTSHFALGFVLIFFYVLLANQDVITKSKTSWPQVNGVMAQVNGR
jgi:hypothetical protein